MANVAFEQAGLGFPRFSGIGSFFIVTGAAVLPAMFPGQGKSCLGMVEVPVALHAGSPHRFIFHRFHNFPFYR